MHSNRTCRERSVEEISTDESNRGTRSTNSNPFQGKSVRANYKKLMQMQALNRGSYKSIISPNKYIELPKQVYLPMKNEGGIYSRENKVILGDGNNARNDSSIQKLEDDIERDNLVLEKHFRTMSDQDIYKDIYSDLDPKKVYIEEIQRYSGRIRK